MLKSYVAFDVETTGLDPEQKRDYRDWGTESTKW